MSKVLTITSAIATSILLASQAYANCDYPERAKVPDGTTATEAEMIEGQKAVKSFMAAMDVYLACLEEQTSAAATEGEDPEITQQREAVAGKRHNAAIDDMEVLAAAFNEQVRAYKDQNQ